VDDADIIKSVQAGDSESFSLLVEKYHAHLLNFIHRLLHDKNIVEDIGQEVFLSIYKSIRNFDIQRGVPFSAWLFITARNRCISELRKKTPLAIPIEETQEFSGHDRNPEQAARDEERTQAIHTALEQLPEPYRQTIIRSLEGDSPEEIAMRFRISPGTVKSRLFRAREKLRILLYEHFGGNSYGPF
jgi:RNA polymerase sigma-70 factor, ECF subfamily